MNKYFYKDMARQLLVCYSVFMMHTSFAQLSITFLVKQPALSHSSDTFFITGNFNGWNPADNQYSFIAGDDGLAKITISLAPGNYEYKFTRGDWQEVEANAEGKNVLNRNLSLRGDTSVPIKIEGWADDFDQDVFPEKKHTASANVRIIDTAFYIPQLERSRRIWLYVPAGYDSSKKRYPVIYMQDGQNLFDDATSYAGEWGIDEYLDSGFSSGEKEIIVVGIDNGLSKRMTEYNPYSSEGFGKGEGNKYVDFLVKNLKPFIDGNYRTLKDKRNTFIAGSSMGALISLYAVLKYPKVFGGAGIFSPSFWAAPGIDGLVRSTGASINSRLYFYVGGKEGNSMLAGMERVAKEIKQFSTAKIREVIDPDAGHNEAAWRKYFPRFYEWVVLEK